MCHQFVISIHAPQWGATAMYGGGTTTPEFQSTHPSGVRQWGITVIPSTKSISIHAPQWGATHTAAQPFAFHHISIHAPQWGATGRTLVGPVSGSISIHAPQWGATALKSRLNDDLCISIHAPQWGATIMRVRLQLGDGFQSTHPSGVRPHTAAQPFALRHISIHAPQWGATEYGFRLYKRSYISIHAPQWGATMHWACNVLQYQNFNPRTPVGCNYLVGHLRFLLYISIHAPQWGATITQSEADARYVISIHAPQWGATRIGTD